MVDRVENRFEQPHLYRVDGTRDALEEERSKDGNEGEDEGEPDNFDKLRDSDDLRSLFNKAHLWQRNIEVKVEDIDKIKVLGVNLKTDPSLLKIRIFLYDGQVIPTAFLSISRELGFKVRSLKDTAFIDVNVLTKERVLRITMPKDESQLDEEITKITGTVKEKTFSQTFKRLISKKSWFERLGVQAPVSKKVNNEIVWVYITVIALITVLSFGIMYLLI